MIEVLNWFAASSTRVIVGLGAFWFICESIAAPLKELRIRRSLRNRD